jgi:hypothetical protein
VGAGETSKQAGVTVGTVAVAVARLLVEHFPYFCGQGVGVFYYRIVKLRWIHGFGQCFCGRLRVIRRDRFFGLRSSLLGVQARARGQHEYQQCRGEKKRTHHPYTLRSHFNSREKTTQAL